MKNMLLSLALNFRWKNHISTFKKGGMLYGKK